MPTARTLIRKAMLEIGALTKTEQPAADEANDALDALNDLIASWSNFSDNIYSRTQETFPLSAAATYTIGTGQTFNTARPIQIIEAYTTSGNINYPLIIINQEQYNNITFPSATGYPEYLAYNNGYPYGVISLYPVPSGVTSITLLTEKAITQFATLDTSMSLPEGWARALIKNLAIDIAAAYGQEPSASLVKTAQDAVGAIKLSVVKSRPVPAFPQSGRLQDIYTGWWV
jgi:hypothetical protein